MPTINVNVAPGVKIERISNNDGVISVELSSQPANGLIGKGQPEAIVPLRRGADGRLSTPGADPLSPGRKTFLQALAHRFEVAARRIRDLDRHLQERAASRAGRGEIRP